MRFPNCSNLKPRISSVSFLKKETPSNQLAKACELEGAL